MVAVAGSSSNVQRILTLRTFPAFAALAPADIAVLARHCRDCFFEKGAILSRSGVPVAGLHLIVEGKVQILRDGKPYRLMRALESVGGIASITQDPNGVDAYAVEDTTTLALDREDMEDVFEDHSIIMLAVMRVLARTLVEARQKRGPTAGYDLEKEHAGPPRDAPLDLMDRIFFLTNTLGFVGATVDALADLAHDAREVRFSPGDVLWEVGAPSDHFVGVVSGMLSCATSGGTQRFRFGAGSTVGGLDAMSADPRWFGAVAETEVVGLRVEVASLLDMFEDDVEMGMAMMRVLAFAIEEQYEAMMKDVQAAGA